MLRTRVDMTTRAIAALVFIADFIAIAVSFSQQAIWSLHDFADFMSYFTIQSNILAIAVLALLLSEPVKPRTATVTNTLRITALGDWIRCNGIAFAHGAVTTYMVITGLIYEFFLTSTPLDLLADWKNTVLHVVTPIAILMLWIGRRVLHPEPVLPFALGFSWLAYPLIYVVYTLLRGQLTGWYPYYFFDPRRSGGLAGVAHNVLLLLVFASAIIAAVSGLGRIRLAR